VAVKVSFIRACKDFFETGENGRKVEISELKALTKDDRVELRAELTRSGYDIEEPQELVESS
jgi:hypothetical protein